MAKSFFSRLFSRKTFIPIVAVFVLVGVLLFGAYVLAYSGKILPRVHVGLVHVGGLTPEQASETIQRRLAVLKEDGLQTRIDGRAEPIPLEIADVGASAREIAQQALAVGRSGNIFNRIGDHLQSLLVSNVVTPQLNVDRAGLAQDIDAIARVVDNPSKDVRLSIDGTRIRVLTDVKAGIVLDREQAIEIILAALGRLEQGPIVLSMREDTPHIDPASADKAREAAQHIVRSPLSLDSADYFFTISQTQIGKWILSKAEGDNLVPELDRNAISQYVTTIAQTVNISPQQPHLVAQDGRVTEFRPPRSGQALSEQKAIELIISALERRRDGAEDTKTIVLPIEVTKPITGDIQGLEGITELIGKATTTFDGSPANRISNIKNGARFLTGFIIKPGEEFSTVKTLGTVDNTTGYLPELVIKGDETIPEFGGGLCQVSTTLFRAILNAGLPVTSRRNHSYRVLYYEKDGAGRFIGPGLDATIYDPDPDLRFKNDTGQPILIYGYVVGTKITFELYGTQDGRTAAIDGPHTLSEVPAGDPVYVETDTLPQGTTKQVEKPRPGGTTIATYTVTYPNGKVVKQEFRSFYRRWPARYLVGIAPIAATPTPTLAP